MKRTPLTCLTGLLLLTATTQAHEHVAAGAEDTAQNAPLIFASDDDFGADTGFVFPLTGATTGPYAGYYYGELTFVALAATPDLGGPEPEHAALGSHIEVVVEAVEGPAGGSFGFWETPGGDVDATELTESLPVGLTDGTYHFAVSENHGEPGADPYGHIHGRIFSGTKAGLYRVGFRFVDTSTNGANNGPIHQPSGRFYLNFQAGLTISSIARETDGWHLTFATFTGTTYQLESAGTLTDPSSWSPAGDAIAGDDHLHTVVVPDGGGAAFFRLSAH